MLIVAPAPHAAPSVRLVGLAMAVGVTALGVAALWTSSRRSDERAATRVEPLEVLLLPVAVPVMPDEVELPRLAPERERQRIEPSAWFVPPPQVTATRSRRADLAGAVVAPEGAASVVPTAPVPADARGVVVDPDPDPAATVQAPSEPKLDLGRDVVDRAVRHAVRGQGRSPVRAMAQASGVALEAEPVSKTEALGAGVARGAKPGCLDANEKGSLLSLLTLPYDALTERCR